MKITRNGKEVKNAVVNYYAGGTPASVVVDGVAYDPGAFELTDDKLAKKTRTTATSQPEAKTDEAVFTTGDVKPK